MCWPGWCGHSDNVHRRTCAHAGVPLVVDFPETSPEQQDWRRMMTPAQRAWLRTTRLPLRSVRFHPLDEASLAVWEQACSRAAQ